jgi:hypothetical protein
MISTDEFRTRLAELCLKSGMVGFPRRSRHKHILLKSVTLTLGAGKEYTEPEIADRLAFWLVDIGRSIEFDHVSLRRELVDARYLEREANGSSYRVADPGPARDLFAPDVESVDVYEAIGLAMRTEERGRNRRLRRAPEGPHGD